MRWELVWEEEAVKVLIVEDEIRIREGLEILLGKYQDLELAGIAEDGEEGLEAIRKWRPDIVITDVRMPNRDGLEMLKQAAAEGIKIKAIVLSAYSEFEYARQAMKLGVTEYLLKPVSVHEFSNAIENIRREIAEEQQRNPSQLGTLEHILQAILNNQLEINDEVLAYLRNNYQIEEKQPYVILCVYLGSDYERNLETDKRYFQQTLSYYDTSYAVIESEYHSSLILIMYGYQNANDLERWLQRQILGYSEQKLAVGWFEMNEIRSLRAGFDLLYPYMDWNISLNKKILISYPKIKNVQTAACIYPMDIETKVRVLMCNDYQAEKMRELVDKFHESFQDGQIYLPKEIKECYVRFLWAVIGLSKEMGYLKSEEIEQQAVLNLIMNAKIREELVAATNMVFSAIRTDAEENTSHLTVKKMQGLIKEYYRSITLEEIGAKLNVTPEYLGTLFHKETGVSFSSYIKKYRITKAKELLCGTEMKLYQIAEEVGYTDSKYFSKVFKEITGQLPTEYRKIYK